MLLCWLNRWLYQRPLCMYSVVCMCVCVYVCLLVCLLVCLFVYVFVFVCLLVCLFACLFVCLLACLFVSLVASQKMCYHVVVFTISLFVACRMLYVVCVLLLVMCLVASQKDAAINYIIASRLGPRLQHIIIENDRQQ